MSRMIETGEVKALFRQLVKAVGGVDAAAVELDISHQRVSFLPVSYTHLTLPTICSV